MYVTVENCTEQRLRTHTCLLGLVVIVLSGSSTPVLSRLLQIDLFSMRVSSHLKCEVGRVEPVKLGPRLLSSQTASRLVFFKLLSLYGRILEVTSDFILVIAY